LRICRHPTRGQCWRHHPIEVLVQQCAHDPTAWRRCRASSSKNVDSAPASHIVWWARRSAQFVSDKVGRVIQHCSTPRDVVTQLWSRAPQQCHGASDMWRRHGRAAKSRIGIIGRVITGTSACSRRGDIRFNSVTPIDCHRAAAAEVSNDILAGVQRPYSVRCGIDSRRIHYSGTVRTVVTCSCHHHDPGSSLSFHSSLQCISRTTF
jgi:hypothetical protein